MNHSDNSNSFNRARMHPGFQQTYAHYPSTQMSQMVPGGQMSQMSQDLNDYSFKYRTNDPSQMIAAEQLNSFSFKNMQLNQSNLIPANHMSRVSNTNQFSQNNEQIDIDTLISPILLKAYTIIRQCECQPNLLDKIQQSLKEKLQQLKKHHNQFKTRMDELIEIAERKQKGAEQLVRRKTMSKKPLKQNDFQPQLSSNFNKSKGRTKNKTFEGEQERTSDETDKIVKKKSRRPGRPFKQRVSDIE